MANKTYIKQVSECLIMRHPLGCNTILGIELKNKIKRIFMLFLKSQSVTLLLARSLK